MDYYIWTPKGLEYFKTEKEQYARWDQVKDEPRARYWKAEGERPEGCSKGCTGRMCRDALHCDARGR